MRRNDDDKNTKDGGDIFRFDDDATMIMRMRRMMLSGMENEERRFVSFLFFAKRKNSPNLEEKISPPLL